MDTGNLETLEKTIRETFGKFRDEQLVQRQQILEIAQKIAHKPRGGSVGDFGGTGELVRLISDSDGFRAFTKGATPSFTIEVPARLFQKNTIVNQVGSGQTLVPSDRGPAYIVTAPERRLTIRGLFRQLPTSSNLIERASEATFTNNAGPQDDDSSPTGSGEGALKNESSMTFTLANVPVVTLAHYIVASRQILSDAPLLQAHLETRLLYGLGLVEETEILTGDGTAGSMTGINQSAAAFTGGSTNATRLDTLARGANQLAVGNYEPSGFILHPRDWLDVMLEKDSNNRYMFADPGVPTQPRLWGLPVVVTPTQTQDRFVVLDAERFGYIADRETATVRISENVNDAFIRNLVHILAEKRCALVVELGGAAVYGNLTFAG